MEILEVLDQTDREVSLEDQGGLDKEVSYLHVYIDAPEQCGDNKHIQTFLHLCPGPPGDPGIGGPLSEGSRGPTGLAGDPGLRGPDGKTYCAANKFH